MFVMEIIASVSLIMLCKVTVMFPLLRNMKCVATGGCITSLLFCFHLEGGTNTSTAVDSYLS
jgi:hypothetical protein